MADWQLFRDTYRSEITTHDWIGGVAVGGAFVASAVSYVRTPDTVDGVAALLLLVAIVNGALEFRAKLRSMREQDRMGWTR
ncbi:MAG TPA: hypothetical protein VF139_06225 [Candidatus Polarisedimenticolaceae bacterium]